MDGKNGVRNKFKTPEGRYELVAERNHNLVQFNYQRCTRLCLADLQAGSPEDGQYILFNVGELVHITRQNGTHKEPLRSLQLCTPALRSVPACMDFLPGQANSVDLLVGLADGTVHLLSLRAQLTGAASAKPVVAATISPESGQDVKCVAALWLPKSDGMFVVGYSNGNVNVYKKSTILGENAGRFSLGLGSNSKSSNPLSTIAVCAKGIHDLSVSPCGARLAAACCDGSLRIVDVATGSLQGGCQAYYGAVLCCSFSPDGRFVAAGGEDDLVAVYSIAERLPIAHLQGHDSWVSRVQWDFWLSGVGDTGSQAPTGGAGRGGALPGQEMGTMFRLASVGQDTQLCLWDVQTLPTEADFLGVSSMQGLSMRKSSSCHNMHGSPMRDASSTPPPSTSHHSRKPSISKFSGAGITPALARADMSFLQPSMEHKIHAEPLSDVAFTEEFIITADHSGCIRTWKRPGLGRVSLSFRQT